MRIYEKTYRSLQGQNGMRNCYTLPFFSEGFIQKVVIQQVGGVLAPFRANLYNARYACQGNSQSSGGADQDGSYNSDPEHYRVIDTINSETPGDVAIYLSETGHSFVNRDNDGNYTSPVRRIYVEIEPEGSGDSSWDITIGGYEAGGAS